MLINELDSYYRSLALRSELSVNYTRNLLKEQLHFYLLDFLYKHEKFRNLIFYGGTCLRHCFNLPRLSEDLDFEYLDGDFPFDYLANELTEYFKSVHHYDSLVVKAQKIRLYLKFPVLQQLGIARPEDSDFLHIKIEINSTTHNKSSFVTEIQPLFVMQRTFFVQRYDLSTLMASKINALINRSWSKKSKKSDVITDAKGRDYFDLIWYMQKAVQPKLEFTKFKSMKDLWLAVETKVQSVNPKSIQNDLLDFLENPKDALDFSRNFLNGFKALRVRYSNS